VGIAPGETASKSQADSRAHVRLASGEGDEVRAECHEERLAKKRRGSDGTGVLNGKYKGTTWKRAEKQGKERRAVRKY
jgi:hypothetical protein